MQKLSALWAFLRGKKTYILGVLAIAEAVLVDGANGDWPTAWQKVEAALLAMGIRHGIN